MTSKVQARVAISEAVELSRQLDAQGDRPGAIAAWERARKAALASNITKTVDYEASQRLGPRTPWGRALMATEIDAGVWLFHTGRHGGLRVAPAAAWFYLSEQAQNVGHEKGPFPHYWYEEDNDAWAVLNERPEWAAMAGIPFLSEEEATGRLWMTSDYDRKLANVQPGPHRIFLSFSRPARSATSRARPSLA